MLQKKELVLADISSKYQKISQEYDEAYRNKMEYESLSEQNSSSIRRLKEALREKEVEIGDLTERCNYLTATNAEMSDQISEEKKVNENLILHIELCF